MSLTLVPLPAPLPANTDAVEQIADAPHAYPCRRCLRDADVGDRMLLLSYDPFLTDSPYRGSGPIYVHAGACTYVAGDEVPEQLARRLLSLRAYDADAMLTDADVAPGDELREAAVRMLADPRVEYLHAHNAGPGCFAVRIERDPGGQGAEPGK